MTWAHYRQLPRGKPPHGEAGAKNLHVSAETALRVAAAGDPLARPAARLTTHWTAPLSNSDAPTIADASSSDRRTPSCHDVSKAPADIVARTASKASS